MQFSDFFGLSKYSHILQNRKHQCKYSGHVFWMIEFQYWIFIHLFLLVVKNMAVVVISVKLLFSLHFLFAWQERKKNLFSMSKISLCYFDFHSAVVVESVRRERNYKPYKSYIQCHVNVANIEFAHYTFSKYKLMNAGVFQ